MLKLYYFKSDDGVPNFGDDLNPWIWRNLIGEFLSDDGDTLFSGIGTLLNDRMPRAKRTMVFGSGVGFGSGLPKVDDSWTFWCVRGPLSADALRLPRHVAVTDPALFVSLLAPTVHYAPRHHFSYIPHFRNANAHWARVCRMLGFGYIDPRSDVQTVISSMQRTRVVIAEAMHGAIVSDALGVPWIPVRTGGAGVLDFKWRDWCASLELDYSPQRIVPLFASSRSRVRRGIKTGIAAAQLFRLTRTVAPQLSQERVRSARLGELHDRLERLKTQLRREGTC